MRPEMNRRLWRCKSNQVLRAGLAPSTFVPFLLACEDHPRESETNISNISMGAQRFPRSARLRKSLSTRMKGPDLGAVALSSLDCTHFGQEVNNVVRRRTGNLRHALPEDGKLFIRASGIPQSVCIETQSFKAY